MTTLLERDGELTRLHDSFRHASAGSGRVVFIGGDAGIGKSSLVDSFDQSLRSTVGALRAPPHLITSPKTGTMRGGGGR